MAKEEGSPSEMAHARWSDGINVIFDQNSPASSRSSSHSSCDSGRSSKSDRYRMLGHRRRRYRSSSTSSSSRSRSTSRTRSRSRPRCNRPSSRCRCDNHQRYRGVYHRRSRLHRVRAHSRSISRSPSPYRHSHRRYYRSRSRSNSQRHRRAVNQRETRFSRSPATSHRSRSRSGSSESSLSLSLEDKRELLIAAKTSAAKILGVDSLQLPESVKPILSEQFESEQSPKPEARVRRDPEKTFSQSHEVEPDDVSSPKTTTKKKEISFSINNSVARPIVAAPSTAKVTSRVDSFGRRKPYGHWVPVKSGHCC